MVEGLADKHANDSRLSKIAAQTGWKLGYTPEWKLDNPRDVILADAANILVESNESPFPSAKTDES